MREAEANVAIRATESDDKDSFEVAGRGELQLGVLIETMRREGFELGISSPRVLFRDGESGREEPYETVVIDVDRKSVVSRRSMSVRVDLCGRRFINKQMKITKEQPQYSKFNQNNKI